MSITFLLLKLIPGDPFQQEQALPEQIYQALKEHYYGLNQPIADQYVKYLKQLITFDFGPSLIYKGQDVVAIIMNGLPTSAYLGIQALMLAIPLGLCLGMIAAFYNIVGKKKGSLFLRFLAFPFQALF